ncbi:methyltransferase [Sulfodiicoccus acidiphilus]|uniref:Methyltransferase n=1 Tax=Sulfodiicoccus acidiphilus TaxID=1670455 RepID=A0A348B1R0_9CREN|nr:class I SAM-dependent methyltransferase [Sulfodiicoccus acidiphilus]BBD72112.1 methyltransferase [Sulfodiicoccus acidiphilus]GGT94889.1 methyltransferase [Sulfodiicoccus acidiphilus]
MTKENSGEEPSLEIEDPFTEGAAYASWYRKHEAVYRSEASAVAKLRLRDCLDVGAGTGAFHEVIEGLVVSLDISPYMLQEAKGERVLGDALALPFRDRSFRTSFVASTLCFVEDVEGLLREMRRVSREAIGLCFIPLDSPLGERYFRMGKGGHKYYSRARFLTRAEVYSLLRDFRVELTYSTLTKGELTEEVEPAVEGDAGSFVCIRACPR